MKALFIKAHGGPDKLIYGDRPTPKAGPGQVLVRVKACALNHLDIWVRQGLPNVLIPLPHILGSDVSGVVEKTGADVKNIPVGRRVMLSPTLSCGRCETCLKGAEHLCAKFEILGQMKDGGCAEFIAVPAANVIDIPEILSFEQAASFPLVFLTAWHMLVDRAKLRAGETVLVQAGGSGVGIAAIQIAKVWGAKVIATVGSDDKIVKAKALGADEVVNYVKKDFLTEVRRLTDKRGVDVVLEHIGGNVFEKSLQVLAKGGRLTTCGATAGPLVQPDLRYVFSRNLSIHGSRLGPHSALREALRHLSNGRIRPVVDKIFLVKKAAEAHTYLESRKNFGKVVLTL
jgi:NADPH:quinone reductase-like Zn-dependent oxidoreductase